MQYRKDKKSGNELSVLGLGCMRFPRNFGGIDMKKAESIIMAAIGEGVNYFDTAWVYPGSEEALGAALEKNAAREKVFIASKLPILIVKNPEDFDRFFNEELKRLRTSRIDYYLLHMLTDCGSWLRLAAMGIEGWIADKKKSGAIGQIGFSFHGTGPEFLKLLDVYPWEFCQIQYNYSDENFQAGIRGLKKAAETMPVMIMEPLLGGKLASGIPKAAAELFHAAPTGSIAQTTAVQAAAGNTAPPAAPLSPAAWGLRWVWNQSEPCVVLSGMNSAEQVMENARLAGLTAANSLTEAELDVYRQVREIFNAAYKVHCTGCGYCMPCPHNVNIPGCFASYNASFAMGWVTGMQQYITSSAFTSAQSFGAGNCAACGRCESHCPQKIPVIASLKQVRARMEPFPVRLIIGLVRLFLRRPSPRGKRQS